MDRFPQIGNRHGAVAVVKFYFRIDSQNTVNRGVQVRYTHRSRDDLFSQLIRFKNVGKTTQKNQDSLATARIHNYNNGDAVIFGFNCTCIGNC